MVEERMYVLVKNVNDATGKILSYCKNLENVYEVNKNTTVFVNRAARVVVRKIKDEAGSIINYCENLGKSSTDRTMRSVIKEIEKESGNIIGYAEELDKKNPSLDEVISRFPAMCRKCVNNILKNIKILSKL